MSENLLEQIRERAYAIWERKGKPEGQELEHWLLAEQELTQELANESQIDATEITEEREYLRVFINRLRKKIEPSPQDPQYLIKEPWIGYSLKLPVHDRVK